MSVSVVALPCPHTEAVRLFKDTFRRIESHLLYSFRDGQIVEITVIAVVTTKAWKNSGGTRHCALSAQWRSTQGVLVGSVSGM